MPATIQPMPEIAPEPAATVVPPEERRHIYHMEWDQEGCLRSWSPEAGRTLGWDESEVVGRTISEVPFLQLGEIWRAGSALAMARDEGMPNVIRLRNRRKNGSDGIFHWRNCRVSRNGATFIASTIREIGDAPAMKATDLQSVRAVRESRG
jgi:PAS domain S-box-containing protein